ncbi:MAG TPA: DNA helicase II, partial [Legionellales bacterium]|nr:DNA helicase II [Legionellales bacterium]
MMLLEGLNQKQQQAVSASLGRTLVLAGAGSGKTRVLVSRIAWLIHHHQLSPYGILAVTFTNKAAGEMKERLNALLKISVLGMWVGTFHGICHKLLRRHYKQAKLPEQFQILDSDDQARMIKRVLAALNLNTEQWPIKQVQHFINNKKDSGLRAHKVPTSAYGPTQTLIQIYQAYELSCQQAG